MCMWFSTRTANRCNEYFHSEIAFVLLFLSHLNLGLFDLFICIYWRYWYEQSLHDFSILFFDDFVLFCFAFHSFCSLAFSSSTTLSFSPSSFVRLLLKFLFFLFLLFRCTVRRNKFTQYTFNLNLISDQVQFRIVNPLQLWLWFGWWGYGKGQQFGDINNFMFTFVLKSVTVQTHVE